MSLSSSAMLVEVNISVWTARKLDRTVTEELNNSKSASRQASRVNKNLLAGTDHLEKIQQTASALRHWVISNTLPWSDSGVRILPTERYMAFANELATRTTEFDQQVQDFLTLYPTLISAQAFQLGNMFNRDEYPAVDDIKDRFGVRVSFMPIPEAGDFRVDVATEELDELRAKYEKDYTDRITAASDSLKQRMVEALTWLSDKMDTTAGKKRLHGNALESFIEKMINVQELNITKDEVLNELAYKAARVANAVDIDDLRKDEHLRNDVKQKVDSILDSLSF